MQGWLSSSSGNGEVWEKPLVGHAYAVALLNRGSTAIGLTTTAAQLGLPAAASYKVASLWNGQSSTSTGTFTAQVQPYSTVLLRITPATA